ncbi:hypothetical protein EVG20_g7644 [Dentipellis fragilis]|uniref:Uncharacterized protein n=1 Tax=Dentipellis fragilis TaxID=205917 RepID=A0A4Y9YD63_9AGAM|nr:hypothetical protein EVG20_g7644 [Dentipellis fragilis]
MSRWSQHNDDATRLPQGLQRTGYDADAERYAFKDEEGKKYVGPPGEAYGRIVPESEAHYEHFAKGNGEKLHVPQHRPVYFAEKPTNIVVNPFVSPADSPPSTPTSPTALRRSPYDHSIVPNTFADILPPHLIAAAPPIGETKSSHHHQHNRRDSDGGSPIHSPPSSPKKKGASKISFKAGARAIGRSLSMAKHHEKQRSGDHRADIHYESVREE